MAVRSTFRKYFWCWGEAVHLGRRLPLLVPFVMVGVIEWGLLLITTNFMQPHLATVMVPLMDSLFGEASLHYPTHYYLLPGIFLTFRVAFFLFCGFVLYSWAVFMIIDAIEGRTVRPREQFGEALLAFPSLLVISAVYVLIVFGIPWIASSTLAAIRDAGARFGLTGGFWLLTIVCKTFVIYSIFYLRYYRAGALTALVKSFGLARKRFMLTVLIVATAHVIQHAVGYALIDAESTAVRFGPESIFWLLTTTVVLAVFANFFMLASTSCVAVTYGKRI